MILKNISQEKNRNPRDKIHNYLSGSDNCKGDIQRITWDSTASS